jgi:glycosyltransferase involved in cell wall biosynthesis
MKEPLVFVIIPAYNSERFIRECLDTVIAQTYQNWKAVVVVAPSTDNTERIVSGYVTRDSRIVMMKEPAKSNCATARNHGMKFIPPSASSYVTLLDSDDWWEPERLSQQVQFMEHHPEFVWSMHQLIVKSPTGNNKVWKEPIRTASDGNTFGGMHTILFRGRLLDEVKNEWGYLFNENMNHTDDTDLVARIGKYPHGMIPKAMSGFRRNPDGISYGVNGNDVELTTVKIALRNHAYSLLEFVDYKELSLQIFNKIFHCDIVASKKRWVG